MWVGCQIAGVLAGSPNYHTGRDERYRAEAWPAIGLTVHTAGRHLSDWRLEPGSGDTYAGIA